VIFWTSSFRHEVSFDGLSDFTLDVGLQLNTPPGVYAVETYVAASGHNRVLADGPWITVTVHDARNFAGEIQMNPEMSLRPSARADHRLTCMGSPDYDLGEERQARQRA
jgi:hypothetical protein